MKSTLLGRGILLPTGEISKDKINLVTGAVSCVKKFLVDGGYSGERFANQIKEICGAQVEVVKRNELLKFVVLLRRWMVERLFGWLDKFRRLWKNCERKLCIYFCSDSYFCPHCCPCQKILNRLLKNVHGNNL